MSDVKYTIAHTESSLGWGGQEIRIFAELNGMRERGHHLLLAAPAASRIHERATAAGFEVLTLDRSKWALPLNVCRLADWFGRHRVDLVNPHSSRDAWAAGFAGRLAGVPLIIRSRHFDVPIANRMISRFVYTRLADHLITTGPVLTRRFQQAFGMAEDGVSTLSTGVDPEVFTPDGKVTRFPAGPGQEKWPLIGMIAVLRWAKGHVVLVQAARILHDRGLPVRLLFVGDGPSQKPIEEEIEKLSLGNAVHFTGYRDDVPEILRGLDCAAFPSMHESIPQVALQAMASGIPVVGSDAGGIPSVILEGRTGRVCPKGDAGALANRLQELLTRSQETRRLAHQALAYVRESHSLASMLDRTEALYARLLNDS